MLKILIVDDNIEFTLNIINYVKSKGETEYIFTNISANGEEAYKYLINNNPDLILLDLQMPKLNGVELISMLKNSKILPKIILMTGDNKLLTDFMKLNLPIERVFMKPFSLESLFEAINQINVDINNFEIDNNLIKLLSNFSFNKCTIGYNYILQCLQECLKENKLITSLETNLYTKIAKKNNLKSYLHVKWAIDKCILNVNKYTDSDILNKFFYTDKITSKNFISEIFYIAKNYKK